MNHVAIAGCAHKTYMLFNYYISLLCMYGLLKAKGRHRQPMESSRLLSQLLQRLSFGGDD